MKEPKLRDHTQWPCYQRKVDEYLVSEPEYTKSLKSMSIYLEYRNFTRYNYSLNCIGIALMHEVCLVHGCKVQRLDYMSIIAIENILCIILF